MLGQLPRAFSQIVIRYLRNHFQGKTLMTGSLYVKLPLVLLGEEHWLKLPILASHHGNHLHRFLPQEVLVRNHQQEEFAERSKGDTTCPTTSQNPSHWHPSWLSNACATRKCPESERLAGDSLETDRITLKPETVSQLAEQFSWVPLPLPNKVSSFLSMCVSSDN